MTPEHKRALAMLACMTQPDGEMCVGFAPMIKVLGWDHAEVRRRVRYLARKGLAEFRNGLVTDDGMLAGAGYCVTEAGKKLLTDAELDDADDERYRKLGW